MKITHLDIETAYLNGELEEDIYIKTPEQITLGDTKDKALKLKKAVHGLKQSGRAWNKRLNEVLVNYGLQRLQNDPCVYKRQSHNTNLIVIIYVDDILIIYNNKNEELKLKETLKQNFEVKDLGEVKEFLGMQIKRNKKQEMFIHQIPYINKMLEKFGMSECKPVKTPMETNLRLTSNPEPKSDEDTKETFPFLEGIGSLLYCWGPRECATALGGPGARRVTRRHASNTTMGL